MYCSRCNGTGRYLGNGMMLTDCNLCIEKPSESLCEPVIDKKSKPYQKAIKEIMALNPSITRKEATKMFEDAYEKV